MKNTESEQFLLLEEAVQACRKQDNSSCLWRAEGLAIKFDGKIPAGSIVSGTHVLVSHDDSCLIMLICISKTEEKATAPEMERITEIEPEPTAAKDYSAYLGTWKYKEVPDSIPDEIMNNDISYKTYIFNNTFNIYNC